MDLKVIQIGQPVLGDRRSIQAASENGIAVAFSEPKGRDFRLNQILRIDLEAVDVEQVATNLTTGDEFSLTLQERDMHDLCLPSGHGTSRFPALARRRGG